MNAVHSWGVVIIKSWAVFSKDASAARSSYYKGDLTEPTNPLEEVDKFCRNDMDFCQASDHQKVRGILNSARKLP